MDKKTTQYLKNYFSHNGIVLACELLIVLLLSLICTMLIGGQPKWLAPTLSVVAYLLAELRFMMAYIAKCVKRDQAQQSESASKKAEAETQAEDATLEETVAEEDEIVEEEIIEEIVEQELDPVADVDELPEAEQEIEEYIQEEEIEEIVEEEIIEEIIEEEVIEEIIDEEIIDA